MPLMFPTVTLRPRQLVAAFLLLIFSFSSDAANAQRELSDIPVPDPQAELASFQVAEGFEVNLFAADPLIAKPIQMNFDAAGRLWVATSEVYPQITPGEQANDKILVLEDLDGDGRADKTTVFADGLLIPTGIEPGDGGAYVADSTELLHLIDEDGDGRSDRRRVMLSGFGTEDTHHILHTLRWGHDGFLYMNQSIYIHSHIETPYGVRRLNAGGIWRFRPETFELEVFIRGLVNPWGHHFDRFGQSFGTDGAGGEGINFFVPDAYYVTAAGARRILHGLNPGSPKHCGAEVLGGRHLPPEWRGNILTNDFRANRVCRFILTEDGAGYSAREQPELIRATSVAFRPVDIKMGPDGAIYIADWYNPIIQHGEVDFRDPRRDHVHGRIWRVTAKGRPLVKRPHLVGAETRDLLDALKSAEPWTRHHARRMLKERGRQVIPELSTWVESLDESDPQYELQSLDALWTYQSLNVVNAGLLDRLLKANDPRVRAAATRLLRDWHARLDDPLSRLAPRVVDDHPRVRLEAVCALRRIPTTSAAEVAMRALDRPLDQWLDYALWQTARRLAPDWLPAARSGKFDFAGNADHLTYALVALDRPESADVLVRLLHDGRLPASRLEAALAVVARHGNARQLGLVLDTAIQGRGLSADERARLIEVLAETATRRKITPSGDLRRLLPLFDHATGRTATAAVRAAGIWKIESARGRLVKLAAATESSRDLRRAATRAIADLGGPQSVKLLQQLASADHPQSARLGAAAALVGVDLNVATQTAANVLATPTESGDPSDLFQAFLTRPEGPVRLAKAIEGKAIPADVAKIGLRMARSRGKAAQPLIAALQIAGGLAGKNSAMSPEQRQSLIRLVQEHGDPQRGEALFRRQDLACQKCHSIGGSGGLVGPDLLSIGASAPVDYLVDSLIAPNKAVKENYHAIVVTTDEGKILSGIKVRETGDALILRTAEDKEIAIPTDSIDEQAPAQSIMPSGLIDPLTSDELADLVRFLSSLGKVPAYSIAPGRRVVRTWRVLQATDETRQLLRRTRFATAAGNDPRLSWLPAYSRVDGSLPLAALPAIKARGDQPTEGFARFQIDVTTPGKILLTLSSPSGLEGWLDGNPIKIEASTVLELPAGRHTVCLAVNLDLRSESLQCELHDAPDSTAQAQLVGGK